MSAFKVSGGAVGESVPAVQGELMLTVFKTSAVARILLVVGIALLIAAVVAWNAMTPLGQTAVLMKLAGLLGLFAPAIVLGALWGWIRYSRSAWAQATVVLFILTIALIMSKPEILP